MMKEGHPRQQRDRLFAGIDQFPIHVVWAWRGAHTKQAVFTLQDNLAIRRRKIGDARGQTYAKIDIGALSNVLRHAGSDRIPA